MKRERVNKKPIYTDIHYMRRSDFFTVFALLVLFSLRGFSLEKTHIVEKGETLYSLAREYNVTVRELAEINHFSPETHIKIGQKLVIPEKTGDRQTGSVRLQSSGSDRPAVHIVAKGETLYGIAAKYRTSVEKIVKDNNLKNNTIYVGQKLTVVNKASSSSSLKQIPDASNSETIAVKTDSGQTMSVPVKNKAVIAAASDKNPNTVPVSGNGIQKKKVVSSNKNWPASGDVYYFRGKIPGVEIDIKGKNDVVSVCNGTIKTASSFRGYGHVVVVESYNNMLYTYAGFDSIVVKEGDTVKAGEKLGEMNPSLSSEIPRIYLFVYQNGTPVNPVTVPRFR